MNEDSISRQAAIDLAMQYCPDDDGSCSKADRDIRELLDDLENMPSAQPERKTGEWIVWNGMDVPENHGRHKCSECGEFALLRYEKPLQKEVLSDFCPNCGADMRGEQNDKNSRRRYVT